MMPRRPVALLVACALAACSGATRSSDGATADPADAATAEAAVDAALPDATAPDVLEEEVGTFELPRVPADPALTHRLVSGAVTLVGGDAGCSHDATATGDRW